MIWTILLWCVGIGAALFVLWWLFVLVAAVVEGYAQYGLNGAILHALGFLGISFVMLFFKILKIVFSVAVFILVIWLFRSCWQEP